MSFPDPSAEQISLEPAEWGPPSRAGGLARIALGVCGLAALAGTSVITMGGALVAVIGVLVAGVVAVRRGRTLGRRASWVAAVAAVGVALLVVAGFTVATSSARHRAQFMRTLDSASVESKKAPPPAWMERMAPGADASSRAQEAMMGPKLSRGVAIWGAVVGGSMAWVMISVMIGTLGWGAGLLLAFAFTGRWIGAGAVVRPV
jgi:hypothetical protein